MNYKIICKIADIENSIGKDNSYSVYIPDHDYTNNNLEMVFSNIELTRENDIDKLEYMKQSMPDSTEIKNIIEDIVEYYKQQFNFDDRDVDLDITIRFFLHVSFLGVNGDAEGNEVRISCKNIVEIINRGLAGKSFNEKIENMMFNPKEYFRLQLRHLLAHELFHVFHRSHYISANNVKNWPDKEIDNILKEVFADYFAHSYLKQYIERTTTNTESFTKDEMINIKWNSVVNVVKEAKLFGVGRKKLLADKYSQSEINSDNETYDAYLNDKEKSSYIIIKDGTSLADYAGGYILWMMGNKKHAGKQGKDMKDYERFYHDMLKGNSEEVLYDLIRYTEEWNRSLLK